MRATANGVVGQRLLVAKRQFELWRQGCRGPGRIPTELWVLAAEAAAELGIEETACQLQVNAERLEQWVKQLGLPGVSNVEVEEPSGRKLRISARASTAWRPSAASSWSSIP
jgi:hypothetical protein